MSANIDPRFILASDLQGLFRDKETGLPLRAGYIEIYSENARSTPKPVYQISGSPGSYTYTALPNPLPLTSIGTYSDGLANDIIPYWFPYEGVPSDNSAVIELYFVKVFNSDGVFQFSRIAWPNFSSDGSGNDTNEFINYVPNGQFLAHTDLPADDISTPPIPFGQVSSAITVIAQGGWTFERPNASTSVDNIQFLRYSGWQADPTGNPRYAVQISNSVVGVGDLFKDLRLKFRNVNRFTSPISDPISYTLAFNAYTSGGVSIPAAVYIIKNFGTGGSATTETFVQNILITTSDQFFNIPLNFGDNSGKTIGTLDDDYVQIAIRFPLSSAFTNAILTNFILVTGADVIDVFNDETNADMLTRGVAGWMPTPNPDGSDLFLPLRLTKVGLEFDHTIIGKIFAAAYNPILGLPDTGELFADGSQYETIGYSGDGIPYYRLQQKLFDSTINAPIFGTGRDYITAYISDLSPANQLHIATNSQGPVTNSSDGSPATGFTIDTITKGTANLNLNGYITATDVITVIGLFNWLTLPANIDVGGLTITTIRDTNTKSIFDIMAPPASSITGGQYFIFSNDVTNYYMWFKVNGVGVDPAPVGRTGIEVDLLSTYPADEVARCIRDAISGYQVTTVVCVAGSLVPAGSYFKIFGASSQLYVVWYKVDGSGPQPVVANAIYIEVDILSTDTAAQVAAKTQGVQNVISSLSRGINCRYFAVPDLRGQFLRGWDHGAGIDPNVATRYSLNSMYLGDFVGTQEYDETYQHSHGIFMQNGNQYTTGAGNDPIVQDGTLGYATSLILRPSAGPPFMQLETDETRPINVYVNFVIKY